MQETVKFFSGIIIAENTDINKVYSLLENTFGNIDLKSEIIPFNFTDYYEKEMGRNLRRQWVSFEKLIPTESLADIKLAAINIEKELKRTDGTRTVNLDPGYITLYNLILASTKNYSHRIYIGKNIYAEITLIYKSHTFHPLEWTYPDYKENTVFFEKAREMLKSNKK